MQTTQALTGARPVRTDLAAMRVVSLALGMVAVAAVFLVYRMATPSDASGHAYVTSSWTPDGIVVASVADGSGSLRAGDVVTAVNGVALDAWLTRSQRPSLRQGDVLRYSVLRDGEPLSVAVTLVSYSLLEVLAANWGTVLWLLLMLVMAVYLFAMRPREPATRVFLVLSAAIAGSSLPWMLGIGPPDLVAGPLGPLLYLTSASLLYAIFWSAILHFALVFPKPLANGARQRALTVAAYAIPIGGQAAWMAGTFFGSSSVVAWIGRWSDGELLLMPAVLLGSIALGFVQWRRASSDERRGLRFILAGSMAAAALSLLGWYGPAALFGASLLPWSAVGLAGLPFPAGIAFAVRRDRLFGITTILDRSLVYGGLTAGVALVYGASVILLNALLPGDRPYAIWLIATGAAALVALPLRDRLQHGVSRLLYGDRDEPSRAIRRLGERLEASLEPEAVLPMVAETVTQALRLPYAAIELRRDGKAEVAAAHGTPVGHLERLPLAHRGEEIGWLVLAPRGPEEEFSTADRALLADLARQAGAAAYAVRLTRELQRSRQQLVSAREEERRRLRRDLHDGLGPTLAASLLKLEAARRRRPDEVEATLDELATETRRAIDDVRRLAYDLRPPILDQLGLVGALRQEAERLSAGDLTVTVTAPDPMPELEAAVEVAAYRIGSEALANVVRHAQARRATLELRCSNGAICLEVADDGRGIGAEASAGVGLSSMRERAEELGGELTLARAGTGGLSVTACIPQLGATGRTLNASAAPDSGASR
jgi:signal transduction histidine kinase